MVGVEREVGRSGPHRRDGRDDQVGTARQQQCHGAVDPGPGVAQGPGETGGAVVQLAEGDRAPGVGDRDGFGCSAGLRGDRRRHAVVGQGGQPARLSQPSRRSRCSAVTRLTSAGRTPGRAVTWPNSSSHWRMTSATAASSRTRLS